MTKPSLEDVLDGAGEPVGFTYEMYAQWGESECWRRRGFDEIEPVASDYIRNVEAIYTEAQAFAMYAAGEEAMRQQADMACASSEDTGNDTGIERDVFIWNKAVKYCRNAIRALPITTNTEGEQS